MPDIIEFAGIDLGAKNHAYCVIDAKGKVIKSRSGAIPNTQAGYLKMRDRLRNPDTGEFPPVATESERGLFPLTLRADGAEVFLVSPLQTSALRAALGMGRDKSDARDAEALAHGLRISGDRIRLMRGVSDHIRSLQAVTRSHIFAAERAEQTTAVLWSHLFEYWPAYIDKFDATKLRKEAWTRQLVATYPTPDALAAATDEGLTAVLRAAGRERRFQNTITEQIRPLAGTAVLRYPESVENNFGAVTAMLVAQVDAACDLVESLEAQVTDLYLAHPFSEFFDALPGVGLLTGARLLAEIGDDPFRFPRPSALQSYGGCRPQTNMSGNRVTIARRRARNSFLERTITSWGGQIAYERKAGTPPISAGAAHLYRSQSDREGKSTNHARRVVGQRLLGGLWHCLTYAARRPEHGRAWDEWNDGIVFSRQYAQLQALGQPATPAKNADLADRKHRRNRPATGAPAGPHLLLPALQ